jgi:hypothetical protein
MCALLVILLVAGLAGLIAGWIASSPRVTLLRPHNKPKKNAPLPVLVPPGPPPRLIPGESPKAVRSRSSTAQLARQTPSGTPRSGMVDYIAVFSDSGEGREEPRVDFLLEPGEEDEGQGSGS